MAISVRDIQEKEFATQAKGGYNVEEVDDFLDEIAEQLSALVRENLELTKHVGELEGEVEAAKKEAEAAAARTPDYNEQGYFDNLQKSMREAMIGAQRIADETKAEAETQAAQNKDFGRRPIRSDVTPVGLNPLGDITLMNYNFDYAATNASDIKEAWQDLLVG